MRRHSLTLVAALGGAAGVAYAVTAHEPAKAAATQPTPTMTSATTPQIVQTPQPAGELPKDTVTDTVQIALLLDTSSSMDGLINQARSHLWNMVDQMGKMTRVVDGKQRGVKIQLALYEYGNDTLSAQPGYIRQVQAFTGDLDKVSEKLHALFTNGGSEYAGQAITVAIKDLQCSKDPSTMRFVFVAGNEGFDPKYNAWFMDLYGQWPDRKNVADAIASYEESLETADTEFDAWMQDRPNKMTDAAVRGREIFMSERAKCFDCHFSPDFTGDEFRNIGLYDEIRYRDKGRYEVTGRKEDLGKFKVPGLRNVAVTAPYMHDGSLKTLDEVIEYYSDPYSKVPHPVNMDSLLLKPIHFTAEEKSDLRAFLESLTDRRFLNSRP